MEARDGEAGTDGALGSAFIFVDASPTDTALDASITMPEVDVTPYAAAAPRAGKAVGHTSVVFKLELTSGLEAAFKPESKRGRLRYRGEVAAYRLARALGLRNVPPAIARSFPSSVLRASLATNTKALALYDAEVIARAGTVRGALMPWIPTLAFLPIETDPWRVKWGKWLMKGGELPAADTHLASQIATLVAFDAITGNWDRWSGANVGLDKATDTLLFVDNDGAFFEPAPAAPLAAQLELLKKVYRHSRRFIAALRTMGPLPLADAIGEEAPGTPLLDARTIASVDERRRSVLAIVDAEIAELGEARVLAFE